MHIEKTLSMRMPESETVDMLTAQLIEYKSIVPDLHIKHKKDFWLWRFAPRSAKRRTTTFFKTIWLGLGFEEQSREEEKFAIIAHEFQHILDYVDKGFGFFGFIALYLYPQIFAIVPFIIAIVLWSMGGVYTISAAIVSNIALFFLIPWDSSTRMRLEVKGYSMELAVAYLLTGRISIDTRLSVQKMLRSPIYYGMAKGDLIDVVSEMVENVRGPKWPKNLSAFGPTASALLKSGKMHKSAKASFSWPKSLNEGDVPKGKEK